MFRLRVLFPLLLLTSSIHAATFTVTSSDDSGPGTLRQAILDANANPGRDEITFQSDVFLTASLPPITGPVDVDGTSSGTGRHRVQFSVLFDGGTMFHFAAGSETSTIRDLWLRFLTTIRVSAANVTVARNRIDQANITIAGASNTIVGGPTTADANTILPLLQIFGAQSAQVSNNRITTVRLIGGAGNRIGSVGSGNALGEIDNQDAVGTIIEGNTFTGAGTASIVLRQANVGAGPTISSNLIQTASTYGILLAAQNAVIEANTISGHAKGIAVLNNAGFGPFAVTGASIIENSIFDNGIAIDLHDDGPTPNDPAPDADTGGNNRQNFPVLTSAVVTPGSLLVEGTLTSAPLTPYQVEIFSDTAASGQARTFLGTFTVNTGAAGNATFSETLTAALPASGEVVTATATNRGTIVSAGNGPNETSEVSAPVVVVVPGQLAFDPASYTVNESDGTVTVTVLRTGGSDGMVTVNYTTTDGTATSPGDYQTTAGTLTFGDSVTSQTIVIPITSDAVPEPSEAFTVTLFDPMGGATLGTDTATVTIAAQAAPVPIPTLSWWALIVLALTLAVLAAGVVRA